MDVAEQTGMSRDKYWRIENGYDEPSTEEQAALATVFHVSVDEIFQSTTTEPKEATA